VTNEVLGHFRNLLLVKTAPGQPELLDVTDDEAERLTAQAAKYSAPELARVISLLLAAQTDMRWTTSPRLSLELALIRSTIPEADERPEALVSRLERLERLSGIGGASGGGGAAVPAGSDSPPSAPSKDAPASVGGSYSPSSPATPSTDAPPKGSSRPSSRPDGTAKAATGAGVPVESEYEAARAPKRPQTVNPAAESELAAGTPKPSGSVDVGMLRSSWQTVIQHLRSQGKAVLPSFLEVATPAAFDGQTLELVFPPDRRFGVSKVEEREGELRQALHELLGIAPVIRCVVREPVAGTIDVEDDPPLSEEEALARLTAELGATPATEDGS
jgi:DNA polymerase-3 subunit gamma/tau